MNEHALKDLLFRMADDLLLYKYIIKNMARKYGKTVTFMPKPIFGDNGTLVITRNGGGDQCLMLRFNLGPQRVFR